VAHLDSIRKAGAIARQILGTTVIVNGGGDFTAEDFFVPGESLLGAKFWSKQVNKHDTFRFTPKIWEASTKMKKLNV